jgi:hypothetical protein
MKKNAKKESHGDVVIKYLNLSQLWRGVGEELHLPPHHHHIYQLTGIPMLNGDDLHYSSPHFFMYFINVYLFRCWFVTALL